jgi:DEAD/DEAH box helicase domain-containing protein
MSGPQESFSVAEYLRSLKNSKPLGREVVHHRILPAKKGQFNSPDNSWPKPIQQILKGQEIDSLYSHQSEALNSIRQGQHTVISTPTASGKTLIYTLPVLESIASNPESRSIFLFPLKALAQDQLRSFENLVSNWRGPYQPRAEIYDGDTSSYKRNKIRNNLPHVLLTNPDMLHSGIMPYQHNWAQFFADLKYIVVDEVHTYRGIMGSHMAWVFRRLLRICHYYGAEPTFVFCSATIGNPGQLAEQLTDLPVKNVSKPGAPQGKRHMLFLNPLQGAAQTSVLLLQAALARNMRTIVYTQSRKMTELISLWAAERCKGYAKRISAYRAGFLPEERREIESKLSSGELLAVISTSALELGIDIGSLDLCILVGYPGSVMATWQRGGRVGRDQQESAVILLGHEDALDQYFMANPEKFFHLEPEAAVVNPYNQAIMKKHLECAAAELPLQSREKLMHNQEVQKSLQQMEKEALLLRSAEGEELFAQRKVPQRHVQLRGTGSTINIFTQESKENIGTIDYFRAFRETFPGAVYLHRGVTYLIQDLHLESLTAWATKTKVDYFTRIRTEKQTEILETYSSRQLLNTILHYGRLRVTESFTGFEKRSVKGQILRGVFPLQLPPLIYETEGIWLEIPPKVQRALEKEKLHFMGGIHALEHAAIGMLPLLVLTDRNDLGGISAPSHPQLDSAAVFIYEGIPGGVGLCKQAFAQAEKLLEQTKSRIGSCACEYGCPSCVHSPKCGSGNRPIDKNAAYQLLQLLQNKRLKLSAPKTKLTASPQAENRPITPPKSKLSYGVLDLETQRSAQEVGGWKKAHKMGISCVVLYHSGQDRFLEYREQDIPRLEKDLQELELIIGFNIINFDYQVLNGYSPFAFYDLPTLDLLKEIHKVLSYRLSLDNLTQATLEAAKTADGLQALRWWKQGKIDKIIDYCRQDVALTRDLYLFGRDNGYVLFKNKAGKKVRLPVNW